jgi:integrase
MHPTLIDLGFLDYHAALVEKQEPKLFPDIERDTRGQISGQPSGWFRRYMARVKLRQGKRINFHSFRHTVADALRLAGFTNDQIGPLLGHASGSMTARYGLEAPVTVEQRAKMIESINYGIDLSHLVTWKGVGALKEAA